MLSLVYDDIVIGPDFGGVVSLGHTKSGKRHAAYVASTILDPLVGKAFKKICSMRDRHGSGQDFIYSGNLDYFYGVFYAALCALGPSRAWVSAPTACDAAGLPLSFAAIGLWRRGTLEQYKGC